MRILKALVMLVPIVAGPRLAEAQYPSDTLALADAIGIARAANPALLAARLRADAAVERVSPAGALPDPQLSFGFRNWPTDFDTDQGMTMNSIQLMQRFPWPGKLKFGRERMRHLAVAGRLETQETEVVLVAGVKSVYYQVAYVDRALRIMEETRELLRDFYQVSSAMYGVGRGLQQDVLQAQVAIATMTEDITVMEQGRVAMVARLNALLGRAPTVPVGALELPVLTGVLPTQDLLMSLAAESRPALRAARERARAAAAGYRAARRTLYPDLTVTLGYGQRPQFENLATLMFGISVPLWAGSRQLPLRREMAAMQAMEEAKELDLYNETFARIAELTAEADRARSLSVLYATAILPQARAAVESALSAYRVGEVDYMTLVQNEMTVNRYEIESVRLTAEYHRAVAQIEALIGGQIGEVQ
ncbi:MAG: TolC family protein [Gemmatimonadetes bacterium]|nr:TolC family protein [Gemmatimonadota bacterium]